MVSIVRLRRAALVLAVGLAWAPGVLAQTGARESLFSGSVGAGARAFGMGGAFVAVADDATAASWNPAGLCVLEKPEASIVFQPRSRYTFAWPTATHTFTQPGFSETVRDPAIQYGANSTALDFASATYPIRMGAIKLVPQVSFQRAIDFGRDLAYNTTSEVTQVASGRTTRFSETTDSSQQVKGGIDVFALSLGIGLSPKLYLGATVNRWTNGSNMTRNIGFSDTFPGSPFNSTTTQTLEEKYRGTNFVAGVLVKPVDQIRLGAVFRSAFDLEYDYHFTSRVNEPGGIVATSDTVRDGQVHWPRTIGAGMALAPTDALTIAADFTTIAWSRGEANYTSTTQTTRTGRAPTNATSSLRRQWPTFTNPDVGESTNNPYQSDTQQLRVGLEYVVKTPGFANLVAFPLRAGGFRDKQYIKDRSDLGDVLFNGFTAGFGLAWSRLSLDFGYVLTRGAYRCCESDVVSGNTRTTYHDDADDIFRSHRFYVSSIVRF